MFYATTNYDAGWIEENAIISSFETMDELRTSLLESYGSGWNHEMAIIESADFWDCWIKTTRDHNGDPLGGVNIEPFSADDLIIQAPGQHPGLPGYFWITPRVPIFVVTSIEEIEEMKTNTNTLHDAVLIGNTIELNDLIAAGANVNAQNDDGWTPLHRAAYYGYADAVNALIAAGADVNAKDCNGFTPIDFAVIHDHADIVDALIVAGAES